MERASRAVLHPVWEPTLVLSDKAPGLRPGKRCDRKADARTPDGLLVQVPKAAPPRVRRIGLHGWMATPRGCLGLASSSWPGRHHPLLPPTWPVPDSIPVSRGQPSLPQCPNSAPAPEAAQLQGSDLHHSRPALLSREAASRPVLVAPVVVSRGRQLRLAFLSCHSVQEAILGSTISQGQVRQAPS